MEGTQPAMAVYEMRKLTDGIARMAQHRDQDESEGLEVRRNRLSGLERWLER